MKVFEDYLSALITDMVEICLEYIDEKAEKIYIMTGAEDNILSGGFFYKINGMIVWAHKVNEALTNQGDIIDVSVKRQNAVNRIIVKDVEELTKRCKEFNRDIPTQMKIVYEVNTHKLDTGISYDLKYTNTTDKCWANTFEEWFAEVEKQEGLN